MMPQSIVMKTFSAVRSGKRRRQTAEPTAATLSVRSETVDERIRFQQPSTTMATILHDFTYIRCAAPIGHSDLHEYATNDDTSGAITSLKTDALGVIAEVVYLGKHNFDQIGKASCRERVWQYV